MWISELQAHTIKPFAGLLQLSKGIHVLVGKNTSGKSTLLQCVLSMQFTNQHHPLSQPTEAIRIGASSSTVHIHLQDIEAAYCTDSRVAGGGEGDRTHLFTPEELPRTCPCPPVGATSGAILDANLLTNREPHSFILPYTLKGLAQENNQLMGINSPQPTYVLESLDQLVNKIHPLTQDTHHLHGRFVEVCTALIGCLMGITDSGLPGISMGKNGSIPLSQRGEGVSTSVGLIALLLQAEKHLFVIEELENSMNPEPLKLLLEEIKRSAKERHNQRLISTHSNNVVQSLANEEDCTIIEGTLASGEIPEAPCEHREKGDGEARRRVSVNYRLGYSLTDSDMFDGWLILEEASAATIIRTFLLPRFTPKLVNVLGIISTQGYCQVENHCRALAQNFLYLHGTPAYTIWVLIDGGDREKRIIERLQHDFQSWPPNHFDQFSEHDFEKYYPARFQDRVGKILGLPNIKEAKKKKQWKKRELLRDVMAWIDEDGDRAEREFESSAKDVIGKLKNIERGLCPLKRQKPP